MRKILLFILISLFISNGYAQRRLAKRHHIVNRVLSEIIKDNDFKPAGFGFLAIDAKTGQIISSYHPDMALRPASNQKLISTATVLELYGPDYKFETKLEYTGKIDTVTHILHGNIIIKGGGDPTLGSKYFDETKDKQFLTQWVEALKHLHIDSVAGAVIGDAGIFSRDIVPVSWSWTNMGDYYGAGASGLSIFDNYYTIYYNTDSIIGDTAQIEEVVPEVPHLVFDNGVVADTVSDDNSNILGAPYSDIRYLRGELPLNKTNFAVKGSLPDPAYFAAYEVERTLQENGVKFKNKPTTIRLLKIAGKHVGSNRTEIAITYSPPLSKIVEQTNIHSINLFAEHFLDQSGLKLIGRAQTELDARAVMNYWKEKGMDIQGMTLTDGSGLSQYNAVTPRQMVFLLNYMKKNSPYFDVYYNSLPVAGQEGTVEEMFKGSAAAGNLRAKSGTIDRVKAYTGYVTSRSGREIIFSMIVNNFSGKSKEARAQLERLMISLAKLKR
ncbi:MAG: D-alanyl-D-alanine carboxypeptidase DacC [bacterium]|nr:MAG: D-alanyl-D-alanine carboxypeptidase DacC [bacterium]